jgi:hypothetical protein
MDMMQLKIIQSKNLSKTLSRIISNRFIRIQATTLKTLSKRSLQRLMTIKMIQRRLLIALKLIFKKDNQVQLLKLKLFTKKPLRNYLD